MNSPIVPEKFLHEPPVAAGAFDSEDGDDVAMEQEHDAVNETAELAGDPSGLDDGGKLERLMLVHRRLGHPTNEVLARMLRLGGAHHAG